MKHKDRFEHIPVKSLSFPKKREEYGYSYITKLKFKKSEPVKAQIEISRIAENILLTIPEETNELPETIKQLIHSHTSSSPNWIALSPYSFFK